jgi:hypothetical protein
VVRPLLLALALLVLLALLALLPRVDLLAREVSVVNPLATTVVSVDTLLVTAPLVPSPSVAINASPLIT